MVQTNLTLSEEVVQGFLRKNNFAVVGLYGVLFPVAVIANVLLIVTVVRDRFMQNVTNYFLVNLSVADLLVAVICMPTAAWRAYTDDFRFGEFTCKISVYLQCIAVASSIFTITAMAVDRSTAIIRPFFRCFNKTTTILVIMFLWTASLILFSPNLWIASLSIISVQYSSHNSTSEVAMCRMDWADFPVPRHVIGIIWFTFMFAVPGFIMTIAYAMMGKTLCTPIPQFDNTESACIQQRNRLMKSRKRVACILLLLAFVFAGCWLPYHIMSLITDTTTQAVVEYRVVVQMDTINAYLLLLGHANSALNPIIYCALSRNFRNSIKQLLRTRITFRKRRNQMNNLALDSSGSGFLVPSLRKSVPLLNQHTINRLRRQSSSQKTTKTCAV